MIEAMKRHEIQVLRSAGHPVREVAARAEVSERSVKRIAPQTDVVPDNPSTARPGRPSQAAPFRAWTQRVLAEERDLPTLEILRLARLEGYQGGKSAFYDLVRSLRAPDTRPIVRFEGVPGEFSQHDFGHVDVQFVGGRKDRVHFFASRLKYSRFAHVVLVPDERVESLVRSLLLAFDAFGGIPLVGVFDNPKTIVIRREGETIVWNETFGQAVLDLRFAPELCWPRRPNQKGAVENLVGWVKSSFFKVRRFFDRDDLLRQLEQWLHEVNSVRPCRATRVPPRVRLEIERPLLRPLPYKPAEFSLRFPILVGPTAMVEYHGIRYSMPPRAIGIPGTLHLYPDRVRIVAGRHEAWHPRHPAEGTASYRPEDRAALLAAVSGDRARLYAKRQQILELGPAAERFLTEVVHRRPRTWRSEVETLYDLLMREGPAALLQAMGRAVGRQRFSAEDVADALQEGCSCGA